MQQNNQTLSPNTIINQHNEMKKIYALCAATLILFTGCLKSDGGGCDNATPQSEEATIAAYCSANSITATKHSSGIFYQIINPGAGATPGLSSKVFVTYTGKLLSGTTFDSQNNSTLTGWPLGDLIQGWQIGIPLIKKGGRIQLVVPSSLAYGCSGRGPIPSNAPLFFDIDLVDVQ